MATPVAARERSGAGFPRRAIRARDLSLPNEERQPAAAQHRRARAGQVSFARSTRTRSPAKTSSPIFGGQQPQPGAPRSRRRAVCRAAARPAAGGAGPGAGARQGLEARRSGRRRADSHRRTQGRERRRRRRPASAAGLSGAGQGIGGSQGGTGLVTVQSKSKETSIRIYNNASHYNEWQFLYNARGRGGLAGDGGQSGQPGIGAGRPTAAAAGPAAAGLPAAAARGRQTEGAGLDQGRGRGLVQSTAPFMRRPASAAGWKETLEPNGTREREGIRRAESRTRVHSSATTAS